MSLAGPNMPLPNDCDPCGPAPTMAEPMGTCEPTCDDEVESPMDSVEGSMQPEGGMGMCGDAGDRRSMK